MKKFFILLLFACATLVSANAKHVYFHEPFNRLSNSPNLDMTSSKVDNILYWRVSPVISGKTPDTTALFSYFPDGGYTRVPDRTNPTVHFASSWQKLNGNVENWVSYEWLYNANLVPGSETSTGIKVRTHPDSAWITIASIDGPSMPFSTTTAATGPQFLSGKIPSSLAVGIDSVQIAIFFNYSSDASLLFLFFLDNISFVSFDDVNGQAMASLSINSPGAMIGDVSDTNYMVKAMLTNESNVAVSSVELSYTHNGGPIKYKQKSISPSMEMFKTTEFNFTKEEIAAVQGENNFEVWISKLNDSTFTQGELGTVNFSVYVPDAADAVYPIKYLVEHFTSSTCGPCAGNNTTMNPYYDEQEAAGKLIFVKYQVNWPGNGDPYYVAADAGARVGYYGINSVPTMVGNASTFSSKTVLGSRLTAFEGTKSYMSISIDSAYISQGAGAEKNIYIEYTVTSKLTTEATVQTIVFENVTTKNRGTNGEREFHHVVMKMFPDGRGNKATFKKDSTYKFVYTHNMSTTFMEEFSDLQAVVFIQNDKTKEIYATEQSHVKFDGYVYMPTITPAGGTFTDSILVTITTETPDATVYYTTNGKAPTEASLVYPDGGFYLYASKTVKAIARKGAYNSYVATSVFTLQKTPNENLEVAGNIKAYPNPTSDYISIESPESGRLFLYNSVGTLVYQGVTSGNKRLSLAGYSSGVYTLKVVSSNGVATSKIIKK
ncbi:MAG: chitobiase/beta-hexosaminidase C-terminal domain-containing protein [Bacteroidales bacterium]|jgi:hypothetical protein|nr:chitobiase/beta-hexosaminidase C-terminal domain-containing protein [Bacteroidales bacterium]